MTKDILALRTQIDCLDSHIVEFLTKRFELSIEIGVYKKEQGLPIFSPQREQEILNTLKTKNPNPQMDEAIETVYKSIFVASKKLQE